MNCSKTLPIIPRDCEGNIGGVKEIYVANKSKADTVFVVLDDGTFDETGSNTPRFVRYIMPRGAATFGTTSVINRETGANYFDNTVVIALNKLSPDGKYVKTLEGLSLGEFIIVVRDNNDVLHLVGFVGEGAMATDGSSTTGAAFTDRNGETITLTASEPTPAPVNSWENLGAYIEENTRS